MNVKQVGGPGGTCLDLFRPGFSAIRGTDKEDPRSSMIVGYRVGVRIVPCQVELPGPGKEGRLRDQPGCMFPPRQPRKRAAKGAPRVDGQANIGKELGGRGGSSWRNFGISEDGSRRGSDKCSTLGQITGG